MLSANPGSPQEEPEIQTRLNDIFGTSILDADCFVLIEKTSRFRRERKNAILDLCYLSLSTEQSKDNEGNRVAVVRAIMSLLPESLTMVRELIDKRSCESDYETHFTLFCYLNWAQDISESPVLKRDVLLILENYLLTVSRQTARAVWMAADLLGCHWSVEEAVPLLIRTAQEAKYSVGRRGSIMGLENILDEIPVTNDDHKKILKILRKISLSDKSKYVKDDAKAAVARWRQLSKS